MAVSKGNNAGVLPEDPFAVAQLPGSDTVYDRDLRTLQHCTADLCPFGLGGQPEFAGTREVRCVCETTHLRNRQRNACPARLSAFGIPALLQPHTGERHGRMHRSYVTCCVVPQDGTDVYVNRAPYMPNSGFVGVVSASFDDTRIAAAVDFLAFLAHENAVISQMNDSEQGFVERL